VSHNLDRLEEAGYIERGTAPSRKRRPLRLTPKGWEAISTRLLMGRVAAGQGLEAVANEEPYSLVAEVLGTGSSGGRIFLKAKGGLVR
jgi:repressor LexA